MIDTESFCTKKSCTYPVEYIVTDELQEIASEYRKKMEMEKKELLNKALDYISYLIDNNAIGYSYIRIKIKNPYDSENIEDLIYASEYSSINEDSIDHSDNLLYGFQQDDYNEEENGPITDNENYQLWKADIMREVENELKTLK